MATTQEAEICTAPRGMFQIVHVDPRDNWPTREGDPIRTLKDVRDILNGMISPQRETMRVFDDKGNLVNLN
ncbi:hypothetical protein ACFL6I_24195 [candidate division KSB1 bacterium]